MMNLSTYQIGQFIPGKGYVKLCFREGCGNRLVGRANKLYCCQSCKTKVATDNRSGRGARTKEIEEKLKKNLNTLDQVFNQSLGTKFIPVEVLVSLNFDWKVFTGYVRGKETGNAFHIIHDMAYLLNDDRTKILILKKNAIH